MFKLQVVVYSVCKDKKKSLTETGWFWAVKFRSISSGTNVYLYFVVTAEIIYFVLK